MARLRAPVATVEMALNARHEGLGVRAAARVVGTSPSNITTWEERLSSHLPAWSPPAPEANPVGVLYKPIRDLVQQRIATMASAKIAPERE
jgi:hypothetical protein